MYWVTSSAISLHFIRLALFSSDGRAHLHPIPRKSLTYSGTGHARQAEPPVRHRPNMGNDAAMSATEFDDPGFLARLRQGDASAYRGLVRRYHAPLVRLAASIIGSHAQAEEVVQDSWIAVHGGIGRFEGRSSLVTWIFSIVTNRARTRIAREGRTVGLGALMEGTAPQDRGVPLSAFHPNGHWAETPRLWEELDPERVIGGRQLWDLVQAAIDRLPAGQRAVILLRDQEGRDAEETCALLQISPENQRVLLHRARCRIREEIDVLTGAAPVRAKTPVRSRRGLGSAVGRLAHALARLALPAARGPIPLR